MENTAFEFTLASVKSIIIPRKLEHRGVFRRNGKPRFFGNLKALQRNRSSGGQIYCYL